MSDGDVTTAVDGAGIGTLILERPHVRNALSAHLADRIADAAARLDRDPAVRAIIVSSSLPEFFSVGADLKERSGLDPDQLMAARTYSVAATRAMLAVQVPMVAAVRGVALGGGLELALTCDLIVADNTAVIGLPETGIGIIPGGGGTQLLPRRIGMGRAAELIYTGRRLNAAEARDYGIVDVLAADALGAARHLAETIAAKSPVAQRRAKAALRLGQDAPLHDALTVEDQHWRVAARSADYREGLAAFEAKRSPRWPTPEPSSPSTLPTGVLS